MDPKSTWTDPENERKGSSQVPIQRQIRFVRNDGHPYQKKRRVLAACITCRKRKTRCSGEKPVCQTCAQSKQQCHGYREKHTQTRQLTSPKNESNPSSSSEPLACPSKIETTPIRPSTIPFLSTTKLEAGPNTSPRENHHEHQPTTTYVESPGQNHRGKNSNTLLRVESLSQDQHSHNRRPAAFKHNQIPHRVPFFRYFGRTAIVPGYKRVIVEVRHAQLSPPMHSGSSSLSPRSGDRDSASISITANSSPRDGLESDEDFPVYDPTSKESPVHPLIIHLVEAFFTSCGCSFPFLHPEGFIPDVKNKLVEPILVDAVCAIGARFSNDPVFQNVARTDAGTVFANRAKALVIDSFSHPSLGATQALLLVAYFEFGQSKDSGLWNFAGTAIRFALDLGINRLEGMRGERRRRREDARLQFGSAPSDSSDQRQVNGEREDDLYDKECWDATTTFWAIYFLDRAISIGTGRTVTLRHDEIEIPMPPLEVRRNGKDELQPCPFAALIRVMSLYGRAADTINSIQNGESASQITVQQLSDLQLQSVETYRSFPPSLAFNVQNFEHYVQSNQSSVFLMLHVWFHALIILLHEDIPGVPAFRGQDARQMVLMSAKTIVDVLKYASDRDERSVVANPFNSQPIYIAAKVFMDPAPSPDFLRCYKAIEDIDQYWSGVHYILTVLDQMLRGVNDPLLYLEDGAGDSPPTHDQSKGWSASGFAGEPSLDVTWIEPQIMDGVYTVDDFFASIQSEMVDVESWDYDLGYVPEPVSWGEGLVMD
ncbi:hypothetical protein EX30DRAFT_363696 [Ascodesmis nigricans]|uniref:Zn(2)-C6 fungal-type domain-containing protein n=1 Tax=Ascodesmis nigricans TaxID=341454 RepID=A0A4S2MYL4_9PEZI|nr:hypothetical protein EX30DRAFT_363696 [Ascodesmis nigricans]